VAAVQWYGSKPEFFVVSLGRKEMNQAINADFDWQRHPRTARMVDGLLKELCDAIPQAANLQSRMIDDTGTRMVDWIDHVCLPRAHESVASLPPLGYSATRCGKETLWRHDGGLFPPIRVSDFRSMCMAIKVDSATEFLFMNGIEDATIHGQPMSPLRTAEIWSKAGCELWVIERHGTPRFDACDVRAEQIGSALRHAEAFGRRRRDFACDADGFDHAVDLIRAANDDLGTDWACDLFFAAERRYWQSRNQAARVQKARQDKLGLGWANHDHHTYRSSRECFARLVGLLEQLGFICRERFYGGAEAGWGAQVLEQPNCGIVIFADVDLSPSEVTGDFAHDGLASASELGTVGLWCKLHGEAMLQAGMHHLECQFDFAAARDQLAVEGIDTMPPFTDFDHLKQAFTEGDAWPIRAERIERAVADGSISEAHAKTFRDQGAIGSHLEILQRDDGYKGFNQTGISEIIRKTDPRYAGDQ
jgi:hypothetical protein